MTDRMPADFDDMLIHELYVTMRSFTKGVNDALKPYHLYSSEWTVMNFVSKHDQFPQSEIAAALAIEGAAISKTLAKMERKGLIARSTSDDKREKRISLSEKGKALFPLAQAAIASHRTQALSHIPPEQRHLMHACIRQILKNIRTAP